MDYFAALTAFVEAAEGNNFSRAAERLGIKASTVSRYVKDLEIELGIALFNRSTRMLHLTEGGQTFLVHARQALDELAQGKAAASALNQHPRGVLRLNLPPAFARHHILPALEDFLSRFPDIKIELALDDSQVDLINSGTDLAIRIGSLPDSTLKARKIADEIHIVVAGTTFAQKHPTPRCPADLERVPAILGTDVRKTLTFERSDEAVPLSRLASVKVNDLDAQLIAARQGLGYAVLPDWLVAAHLQSGELVRWLGSWQAHPPVEKSAVWFIYPPKRIVSAKVRSFIDFMIARFGTSPYWKQ